MQNLLCILHRPRAQTPTGVVTSRSAHFFRVAGERQTPVTLTHQVYHKTQQALQVCVVVICRAIYNFTAIKNVLVVGRKSVRVGEAIVLYFCNAIDYLMGTIETVL